jgi:hypothetical protein
MARTPVTTTVTYGRGDSAPRVDNFVAINGDTVNGHTIPNDGRTCFDMANTHGSIDYAVTVVPRGTIEGVGVVVPETVVHGQTRGFGPYPIDIYGANLLVNVENAALHFVKVFRLPS